MNGEVFRISMPNSPEKALRSVLDALLRSKSELRGLSCPDRGDQARNADKGDGSLDVVG